jgi:hypothetical protein
MILDTKASRTLPRRAGVVGLALAAALVLPLAMLRPVARAQTVTAAPAKPAARPPAPAWTLLTAKDRADERRLTQAQAADPASPRWPAQLGFLYLLHVADDGSPASRAWARASLAQYDRAAAVGARWMVTHRHAALDTSEPASAEIAKMAFAAGDYDRARRCAGVLLRRGRAQEPNGWDVPGDTHAANIVLGRLALQGGDTARAEQYLLAAGKVSESPVLSSFGPNMRLAKDLLAAGKRDTVLAYLDECGAFWKSGGETLGLWKAQVRQGRVPSFGPNLYD